MLTIYQFLKFLKIEWLQEWKENFKLPPSVEEPQLVLSKEEINKLLSSLNLKRFYQFKQYIWVKFLFETGLRVSEFANIRKIDLVNNSFQIVGKGKKQRKVFITDEMKKIVNYWPFESFCVNKKGKILTTKHIRNLIKKIGIKNGYSKLTPHTLRRSFCTHLIKNNCNMKAIQMIMGHSSLAITSRYIHLSEQEIFEEYSKAF